MIIRSAVVAGLVNPFGRPPLLSDGCLYLLGRNNECDLRANSGLLG
jgi:hypothetical protein